MSLLTHRGLLLSGSQDQTVRLWDLREGGCVGSLYQAADSTSGASRERNAVHALAMARKDQLATGTWGGTVRLWDPRTSSPEACGSLGSSATSGPLYTMVEREGLL